MQLCNNSACSAEAMVEGAVDLVDMNCDCVDMNWVDVAGIAVVAVAAAVADDMGLTMADTWARVEEQDIDRNCLLSQRGPVSSGDHVGTKVGLEGVEDMRRMSPQISMVRWQSGVRG